MVTRARRLLVKCAPAPQGARFQLGKLPLRLEPLFSTRTGDAPGAMALAGGGHAEWHIAELPPDTDPGRIWDLCHATRSDGLGLTSGIQFAEPDFEQQWPIDSPDRVAAKAFRATAAADACQRPEAVDTRFPSPNPYTWNWYKDAQHDQLDAARQQIQIGAGDNRVTIAHLDTGYRAGHAILPPNLETAAGRNFVDDGRPDNDATDPDLEGFGNNPGHGTGTISILAGSSFNGAPFGEPAELVGGAPFARIIPVRVANSVVLFTNSSIARGIEYAINSGADVLSMSMGGVPAQVWVDIVNRAYDAGVVLVTAAGNNFGPGKLRIPRFIVYPARFRRVLAACGAMFGDKPYADFLDPRMMAGSYGPSSKMDTAMAAYTPNTAWARYACLQLIDFDGAGTSAATPQIAAAAACWLQKHMADLPPKGWQRVEAVRQALYGNQPNNKDREHFGRGILRAADALSIKPADVTGRIKQQSKDTLDVPILEGIFKVIFGAAADPAQQQMLRVEAAQIMARSGELQNLLAEAGVDPDEPGEISPALRQKALDALVSHSSASRALRQAVGASVSTERPTVAVAGAPAAAPLPSTRAESPKVPPPVSRKLRVFTFDPAMGLRVETESINRTTLEVPWEENLAPGPVGEYLEVIDIDPSTGVAYAPVDLNHPHVLASEGLEPSEGVPQFHQQMVYAVAMTTIRRFEQALGRTALWAPYFPARKNKDDEIRPCYVSRLRIYPHALREANAYYSPAKMALLFGYFQANKVDAGDNLPGGLVFTCLSHDVVAHETTHALLDGLHRYYQQQTNPDIAAFHEAFADVVAIFQHFTIPAALRKVIAQSRGDLRKDNALADLAQQFGQASSGSRALRSGLGTPASRTAYADATEAHDRGAVLLAAVFDAFLQIYEARIVDLKRLATGGTGVLPEGDISVDLINRMAMEASIVASHLLNACIRALDYCPPVDLTFGDYLRALITADMDLQPEDELNYRTAIISGFRSRGIFPDGVRTMSEESLRWRPPFFTFSKEQIRSMLRALDLSWNLSCDRMQASVTSEDNGRLLWIWFRENLSPEEAAALEKELGMYLLPGPNVPKEIRVGKDGYPVIQIHSVRPARRIGRDGQQLTDLVIEAVQRYTVTDEDRITTVHRGGCTMLIDLVNERIRYAIRKKVGSASRISATEAFMRMSAESGQPYFRDMDSKEPFAMLHRAL